VSGKSGLTAVDRFRRPTRSSNYGKVVQLAVLPLQSRANRDGFAYPVSSSFIMLISVSSTD
jgi:hypothetical protein